MRVNKKITAGASAVLILTAAAAYTVSAVDCERDPKHSEIPLSSCSFTPSELDLVIEADDSGQIKDGKASIEVNSMHAAVLPPRFVKALAERNITLEVVSPRFTVSVDPSTADRVKKLDISAFISAKKSRTRVKIGKNSGKFGCEVRITVTSNEMTAERLSKAHVYFSGNDMGPVETDENGYPVITAAEAGTYEIS